MNCMICFVYGLPVVHPNNTPLLVINGGGFLLEVIYIAIFYKFSPSDLRLKIFGILALELAFVICVLASALGGAYTPGGEKGIDVLGIFCIISGILMYGSPVIIIKEVFQTKSVEHMPWHTSLIGIFNAIFWTTYSLLRFDLYILIPNAMGIIFSAVQLIVFLYFKCCRTSTTPRDLESPEGTIIHLGIEIPNAPVSCFPLWSKIATRLFFDPSMISGVSTCSSVSRIT
ncbi:bidirectional sugar transporter SWEET5-like protein [Carex littledalei]|uniref:Bidirectional sugar transporter SWEET5-like protein n=1 Tax=Carex littledalei TaxID=544730 RepID=A0A833RC32_9POAL|nr:bidirectional sugar transporter SWEET5-like protein [Carex littledalei]